MEISIELEDNPSTDVRRLIDQGLDEYNFNKAGPDNSKDLWVIARDASNAAVGGLKARATYSWLFIDWLWVSSAMRSTGVGSTLLDRAENAGRNHGCIGAYVSTHSFQAPEFYRSKGYQEFGRIEDFPPGYSCIWLQKALTLL